MRSLVVSILVTTGALFAQQPLTPVIVVYKEGASLEQYRRQHAQDPRAVANPHAWDYLDKAIAGATQNLEQKLGFRATHVFSASVKGFSASLNPGQIQRLSSESIVDYIEADQPMQAIAQTLPWGIDRIDADLSSTKAGDGSGRVPVNAYIVDTGIDVNHPELAVAAFVNFVDTIMTDCHGHGTHVAGTVAALDNAEGVVGAAPGAWLTAVKVLNCSGSGSSSGVIKAVDWITANAVKPAVANMSLGGPVSKALDKAVQKSADSGVLYAVAGGNSGADACRYSPARAGTHNGVVTVAAVDASEYEPSWSNYGKCVDIWAPGVSILSTYPGGYAYMSGTSMASPHVAGTAALYLALNPGASASTVESSLKSTGKFTGTKSKHGRSILRVNAASY